MIYRSSLCDQPFGSYEGFCINSPNYPWGSPKSPAFGPHSATPLPSGPIKLNQRAAHFRGPFWAISSRLAVPAPALFPAAFWLLLRLGRCSSFCLAFSFLYPSVGGAICTLSSEPYCSFVGSASLPPLRLQTKMAAPLVSRL